MRWTARGLSGLLVVGMIAGCQSLPRPEEVETARTHIQQLKFDKPAAGLINAHAELVIYNPGRVKTQVEGVEAALCRGETVLGRAVASGDHDIPAMGSQRVWLHFNRISVALLEAAIGRTLTKSAVEAFEIDGVIIYETRTGLLRHPFAKFRIQTVLGPSGSGM
jgi:hypothetical protein